MAQATYEDLKAAIATEKSEVEAGLQAQADKCGATHEQIAEAILLVQQIYVPPAP